MSDREDLIVSFKNNMLKVAEALGIHPSQVRRVDYRRVIGKREENITEKEGEFTRQLSFAEAKALCFPPANDNPLSKIVLESLGSDQYALNNHIANVIGECAESLNVPPHELTFYEFRKYINFRYGVNDKGIEAYAISKMAGFNAIRDANFPIHPTQPIIEKRRVQEQAKMNRKLGHHATNQAFLFENIEYWADRVFGSAVRIKTKQYKPELLSASKQQISNLIISDVHFGSDIQSTETGAFNYGRVEEARRLSSIVKQTVDSSEGSDDLIVWLIGDIIENNMHTPYDGARISEQIVRAIWLLVQMFTQLALHFKKVTVKCAIGNHARFTGIQKERAMSGKWDSYETVIYYAVKLACKSLKNTSFHIPKTTYVIADVFDHKILGTHGDNFMITGMTSKSIPTEKLINQSNSFNLALEKEERCSAFVFGHVHSYSHSNAFGVDFITNAGLPPVNAYAVNIGVSSKAQSGQVFFMSTPDAPVLFSKLLKVDSRDDCSKILDDFIVPWSSLD